ncbi:MAG: aldehyde dehydrogenase family protein [Mycobacterium sp.]|uniref:aldehyde dehydrogenase family protein n=1 Tax=Mycobacterium sp. TaxID=1785 RepID=UPI003C5533C0
MTTTPATPLHSGALLIGGERVIAASGGTYDHMYPASGLCNATIPLAGGSEVDRAVESAWEAQRQWLSYPVDRRRDLLLDLADVVRDHFAELAELNVHDYGVPIAMAGNSFLTERFIRYYAGYADKAHGTSTPVSGAFDVNIVEREPYGVVGVIAPWNGPLVVIGSAVVPALAAGNAVIIKPSELAALAPLRFGELCLEAGLPAGLVNVLPGGPEGGDAMVRHPRIRKIHFTGGQSTAQKVLRAASHNLTPVTAELGGKSAYLVFADADIDQAASLAAFQGPITQAGQSCACAARLLVEESVYDNFVEKLVAAVQAAKIGDPLRPDVMLGPVITEAAANRILSVVDETVSTNAGELVTGGTRLGGDLADGYFIEPTVFANVDNRSALAQTETFGPVVSVIPFADESEAVDVANDTRYGLNAFLWTTNLERAHRVARQLDAGSVWINRHSDIEPQSPYGGYKQSGYGRTGGIEGFHDFLQIKNIRIGMG